MRAELDHRLAAEARGPRSSPDIDVIWRRARRRRRARQFSGSAATLAAAAVLVVTMSSGESAPEVQFAGEATVSPAEPRGSATLLSTERPGLAEVTPEAVVNLLQRVGAEDVDARLAQLGDDFLAVRGSLSASGRNIGFHVYESPDADPAAHFKDLEGSVATRLDGHVVYELVGPINETETRSEQLLFACGAVVFNLQSVASPEEGQGHLRALAESILREADCPTD